MCNYSTLFGLILDPTYHTCIDHVLKQNFYMMGGWDRLGKSDWCKQGKIFIRGKLLMSKIDESRNDSL